MNIFVAMDKDQLRNLAESGNFIPGIYNYCDRWCERCPLTSKCLNYATTEADFSGPESKDIPNAAFWDKISEMFKITMEMIQEDTEKLGIDLTLTAEDREKFDTHEKAIKAAIKRNFCTRQAIRYTKIVNTWFDKSEVIFKDKGIELEGKVVMDLPGSDPEHELHLLTDAVDVIRWYQYQIFVKIKRALHGVVEDMTDPVEVEEGFPKDSDGSAKVALTGIDRSIGAWGYLMENLPGNSDDILDILILLEQLRKNVEAKFPDARSFVRPGFDKASSR